MSAHDGDDAAQVWVAARLIPWSAAANWPNNHGRPRQPRPTTTPAQPGLIHHRHRVPTGPNITVASTGTPVGVR